MPTLPAKNENLRIQKLHEYLNLGIAPGQDFNDIVSLAAHICGTPFALITLIDNEREWYIAKKGITAIDNPVDGGFCAQTVQQQNVMVVSNAAQDPRFSANPFVTSEPNIHFYAGAPIRLSSGDAVGAVCVLDTNPRELNAEQIEALRALARQSSLALELRRKNSPKEGNNTEQQLQTTLAAYKEILSSANLSIISTDKQGIIVSFNRTAQRMLGYSEDEVVGKFTPLLFHDANEIAVRANKLSNELGRTVAPGFEAFVAELKAGNADEREWTYIRKDGSRFPVRLSVTTLYGPDGVITGFLKIANDITSAKEAEERLKKSERFTRAVLDALSKQFCVLDAEGNILEVNKPWLEFEHEHAVVGPSRALEIGQNYLKLLEKGLASDRGGEAFAEGIRSVLNGTKPDFALEYSYRIHSKQQWFIGKILPFPDQELGRIIVIHENISEHKHLEYRFRQAVESAPNALVIVNETGTIEMVNTQTELSFGYPRTELIGQPVEMLVPERFRSGHAGFRKAYFAAPQSRPMGAGRDLYGLRKDGSEFPVEIGLSLIDGHEETLVLSSIVDITERKRLEHRFRQAVESAPNAIVMINESGTIELVNAQTETFFAYTRSELIGNPVEMLVPERFRSGHAGFRKAYFTAPQSRPMGAGRDLYGLRKDGSEFPIEIGLSIIDSHEETLVLSTIVDITERKRLEHRFRQAVESAPNAIVMINESGTIELVNAQTETFFAYTRSELIGNPVEMLVPERFRSGHAGFRKAYFAAPQSRPMGAGRDLYGLRKDGSEFPIEIGLSLIDNHEETLVLSTIVDITERTNNSNNLKNALNEKEMLLKEVYHRVKNNLQVVSSLINLQARNVKNEVTADVLKQSSDRIKSMALLHEKLYQSKDLARININDYIRSLVDHLMFGYGAPGKISVDLRIEDIFLDVDTAIPCGLIINELLSNALKHAFPDNRHGEINISFTQNHDECILVIADNGIGFADGQDFKKSDSLGLHLVDTLTGQLMGQMAINQTGGAKFTIRFPHSP